MNYRNVFKNKAEYCEAELSYPNISYLEEENLVIVARKAPTPPTPTVNNQVFYTTTDGQIYEPVGLIQDLDILVNKYEDGQGVIILKHDLETIMPNTFAATTKLETIVLPNSLTNVSNMCFYQDTNLKSVELGENITIIDFNAFGFCSSLQTIKYNGTKAQFTSIQKGLNWKYSVPTDCMVVCNDGSFPITDF